MPPRSHSLPRFPSTVIGSLPRPQYVKNLLHASSRTEAHKDHEIPLEEAYAKLKSLGTAARMLREMPGYG